MELKFIKAQSYKNSPKSFCKLSHFIKIGKMLTSDNFRNSKEATFLSKITAIKKLRIR